MIDNDNDNDNVVQAQDQANRMLAECRRSCRV